MGREVLSHRCRRRKKTSEKPLAAWWANGDAQANTLAFRLTRIGDELAGEVFVTGIEGGVYEFAGKVPAAGETPVVVLQGPDAKAEGAFEASVLEKFQPRMIVITPGATGKAGAGDGGVEQRDQGRVAGDGGGRRPSCWQRRWSARGARYEKVRMMARELKAIDYAREGVDNVVPKVGGERCWCCCAAERRGRCGGAGRIRRIRRCRRRRCMRAW